MKNKTPFIIGLVIITLLTVSGFAYQINSNTALKSELAQNQEDADTKIATLKKELSNLKKKAEVKPKQVAKPIDEADLLANLFAIPPATEEATSGSSLLITPEIFDLGQISKADGIATATFDLKNNGIKPLTISYAFSSCGCTVAPLKDEKILQPGETFPLEVAYDPNYYGSKYDLGSIEKTVTVLSNYAAKPFYKVKLKANVTH